MRFTFEAAPDIDFPAGKHGEHLFFDTRNSMFAADEKKGAFRQKGGQRKTAFPSETDHRRNINIKFHQNLIPILYKWL